MVICPNDSIITRIWVLTDDCDNTTILVLKQLSVVDTTAPTVIVGELEEEINVECSDNVPEVPELVI